MIPKPLHRLAYRIAHRLRHHWRRWRKARIEGVSIIACDGQGRVLLVRHSYGSGAWSLVGGGMHRGEIPEQAAARELREETGCDARNLRLLGTLDEVISGSPHRAHVFACETPDQPRPDGRELIEARFFPQDALPEPLSKLTGMRLALWTGEG